MNSTLSFPHLPFPTDTPFRAFMTKPAASLLLSILLHVSAVAIAFSLGGGAGDGLSGDRKNERSRAENSIALAGTVSLQGGIKGKGSVITSVLDKCPEAVGPVPQPEQEKTPELIKEDTRPYAVPLPVQGKPKEQNKRKEAEQARKTKAKEKAPLAQRGEQAGKQQKSRNKSEAQGHAETAGSDGEYPQAASGFYPGTGAKGGGNQTFAFRGKVDSKPKVISRSRVRYPESARKKRITGHVLLRFHLDERGTISQLQVLKAEPRGIFEEAALAAVRQWRFAPAMKDGRPVPYWVELPMPFILR